ERAHAGLPYLIIRGRGQQHAYTAHSLGPLRARRERPCRRAAEEQYELAASDHSITSSASASTCEGMSRRNALATTRLMTSSNLVVWTTGRSAGVSPLRMRPV